MASAAFFPTKKRDVPNYKAPALQWPFLATLLLTLSALTATLEYLLRVLPHAQDSSALPYDFPYAPFQKKSNDARSRPLPAARQPPHETLPTPTEAYPFTSGATSPAATITPRARLPWQNFRVAARVLNPSVYANTSTTSTFVTVVSSWYAEDPDKPWHRTPLFPGDDVSDKCVYRHQGVVISSDSTGCLAVLGLNNNQALPAGLSMARYLPNKLGSIAFPVNAEGRTCWEELDTDWEVIPGVRNCTDLDLGVCNDMEPNEPLQADGDGIFWKNQQVMNSVRSCKWADGGVNTDLSRPLPQTKVPPRSVDGQQSRVVTFYAGLIQRLSDGRNLRRIAFWDYPRPESDSPSYMGYFMGFESLVSPPVSSGSSAGSSTTVPGTNGGELSPASPLTTTGPHPGQIPDPTTSLSSAPSHSSDVTMAMEVSWFYVGGPMQRETTVQFTASNGLLTTKTKIDVVWLKTTTYLAGVPPVMVAPYVQTVLNADGQPIATTTSFRDGIPLLVPTLTTLLDASGVPTATLRTSAAPTSRIVTLTNNLGIPIATQTQFPVIPLIPGAKPADDLFLLTDSSHSLYFAVYFLPILIAAILLIPIQVLDAEIRLLMPYRLLTRPGGTDAAEALCLSTRGFSGRLAGWKLLLRHREPLAVLSDGLSLCNTVLIALSGEAIGMRLRGHCHQQNVSTCMISLAAFPGPARAAQALMGTMMVLLVVMGRILARWRSGVAAHPASLASVCALLQVPGAVELLRKGVAPPSGRESLKAQDKLRGSWVRIGWAESDKRAEGYGLVFMREGARLALTRNTRIRSWDGWGEKRGKKVKLHVPVSERVNQGAFFGFLCGLLAMILYYQCTMYDDPSESAFEAFVDSQGFGVVALFSALGMLVTFGWEHMDAAFGATSIYLHISQRPQPAARSVLESRATNPFTRLWRALRRRDALTASIAVANILAKFLPMLLSGIPFKSTQTWQSQQICGWTTVALLAIMILVMLVYMRFARWPELPVSPDSLAGVVYYVCDSHMLKDFERLSMLGTRERDRRVERMARRYSFDWITGVSGERRIACDYAEGGQGFKLRSLGHLGFGVGGKMRPR